MDDYKHMIWQYPGELNNFTCSYMKINWLTIDESRICKGQQTNLNRMHELVELLVSLSF